MPTKAERVAKIVHDEVVAPTTPGFTPFWEHQPESYRREAVKSELVLKLIAAMVDDD
ncbi:hypothetical protein SEA_A3WALLY_44 [Microbacterium phage A3Wally]|nr:hypothetical protein SEA_A3WALLY_44 [Microbacterium phage A3Wally]